MKIPLGEKIRELRKRDGRKQEDLANAVGVSAQAVSRWESNGGYPDLEIIPSIANYFHVTIDELFGYNDEREKKICDILLRADILQREDRLDECVKYLRAAVSEFPSESRIFLRFGLALSERSLKMQEVRVKKNVSGNYMEYDTEYNSQNEYAKEAVSVLEKALEMEITADDRAEAVLTLVIHYAAMGQQDKAKALAGKQSPISSCREWILSYAAVGEERDTYNSSLVMGLLRFLKMACMWAVNTKYSVRASEYAVGILLSVANVYKSIISDGKYGIEHSDLSDIYITCTAIYARMDQKEEAMKYFDLALYHKREYNTVRNTGEFHYSSELLSSLRYSGYQLPSATTANLREFCKKLPDSFVEWLKQEGKYEKELFE